MKRRKLAATSEIKFAPPVRSWWKQERREHPRSPVHKPLLQAMMLLTSVLALHTDPSARQILEVIAGMSAEMPLHLVAEGVEDEATF